MNVQPTTWRDDREGRSHIRESREDKETVLCKMGVRNIICKSYLLL